jgi:hypothetical protein
MVARCCLLHPNRTVRFAISTCGRRSLHSAPLRNHPPLHRRESTSTGKQGGEPPHYDRAGSGLEDGGTETRAPCLPARQRRLSNAAGLDTGSGGFEEPL